MVNLHLKLAISDKDIPFLQLSLQRCKGCYYTKVNNIAIIRSLPIYQLV